jgi:phosphoglucosamine mutase
VNVLDAGVLPTPAIAFLTADLHADFGVMLTASHNPMPDNGIKFFSRGGHKLPDAAEDAIEARLGEVWEGPTGISVGRVLPLPDGRSRYVAHLLRCLPNPLGGLKIVIDAAHGAAAQVSPEAFRAAGAEVHVIGAEPDGLNINDGYGATHLDMLQGAVVDAGADLGVAHDGDADRCIAVDHTGAVVDGDQIMSVLAMAMLERGELRRDTLVATVMSNLGLLQAMERAGIAVHQTPVGDRYILEALDADGLSLGGEQSGHLVFRRFATTGDGILTGILLADLVRRSGRTLAELTGESMVRVPQLLVSLTVADPPGTVAHPIVRGELEAVVAELGDEGRVLVRASGTEPVVRVMVEATDEDAAQAALDRLCGAVTKAQRAI